VAGAALLAAPGAAVLAALLGPGAEPLVVSAAVLAWLAGLLLAAEGFRGLGVREGFAGAVLAALSLVVGGALAASVSLVLTLGPRGGSAPGGPGAWGSASTALAAAGLASAALWLVGVLGVVLGVWRLGGSAARLAAVGAALVLLSMPVRPVPAGELLLLALLGLGLLLARCPAGEHGGEEPGGPGGAEAEAAGGLRAPG